MRQTGQVDIILNRALFDRLLGKKSYAKFFRELKSDWDIPIEYKSFLALINNNVDWRLLYAFVLAKKLNKGIEELFIFIDKGNVSTDG